MITENMPISQTITGFIFCAVLILIAIAFIAVLIYILFKAGNYSNTKKMAATSTNIVTITDKQELSGRKSAKKCDLKYTLTFKDVNSKEITLKVSRWEYVMHNTGDSGLLSFHGRKFIGFDVSKH